MTMHNNVVNYKLTVLMIHQNFYSCEEIVKEKREPDNKVSWKVIHRRRTAKNDNVMTYI